MEERDGEENVFEGPLGGAVKEKVVTVAGGSGWGGGRPLGEGGGVGGHGGGERGGPPVGLVFEDG